MVSQLAQKIGRLPEQFSEGKKSTSRILEEAGFPETREQLKVDEVEEVLRTEPKLVDLWWRRARDQRLSGGWGLERSDGIYQVRNFTDRQTFSLKSRVRACAEFVVRYVKFIGDIQAKSR